jgi:hypothetical protein
MLKKITGLLSRGSAARGPGEQAGAEDPFAHLAWVEAEQSPYGMRVLDCRSVCHSLVSTTADKNLAERFVELRESTGEQHRGQVPAKAMHVECNLRYPHQGETPDGPLFIADVMEDKWDIYLFDGQVYFSRSWTGELVFRAEIVFDGGEAVITLVEADAEAVAGDGALAVRQVDFLVKSHLARCEVPHPLPSGFPDKPKQIALYSYRQYGRWASFASYEDTTLIRVEGL